MPTTITSRFFPFAPFSQLVLRGRKAFSGPVRWKEGFRIRATGSSNSENGSDNGSDQNKDEKQAVDWDKAWSSYRKKKKQPFLSMFDMEKYVTRRPQRSNYPLSEEIDPLKRTERSTLGFWTDSKFTMAGFGIILGLFIYMVVIVGAPPPK